MVIEQQALSFSYRWELSVHRSVGRIAAACPDATQGTGRARFLDYRRKSQRMSVGFLATGQSL
jgi:hypothetical protein